MKKGELSFWDRFWYKMIIATSFLLVIVVLDKINIVKYEDVKATFSDHFNIINVLKSFNGNDTSIIPIEIDDTITVSSSYQEIEEITDGVRVNLHEYEAVENYKVGVVISIYKNKDKTYKVTILGSDDYEYVYDKLESIDCHIYKMIASGEIIGKASSDDKGNFFNLYSFKDGKKVNVLNLYEN